MRIYLRVARRLVSEPHLPRPLRWLLVFALLPIPGPVDEIALGVVALCLATFYRPRFKSLLEEERKGGVGEIDLSSLTTAEPAPGDPVGR